MVATKAPWPPLDGGRLLLLRTIEGLAAAGAAVTLAAPVDVGRQPLAAVAAELGKVCTPALVAGRPAGPGRTLARAVGGRPISIARHTSPALRRQVEMLLAQERFDVVHAEQLQALPQALPPARARALPVVLRAQNVESSLWAAAGAGPLWAWEARRLAAWEGRAVASVDATAALTAVDAAALSRLATAAGSPGARVIELAAPFAADLAAGPQGLPGEPAVVILGSLGWRPNQDALAWFADRIWPAVRASLPQARLHVFGVTAAGRAATAAGAGPVPGGEGIEWHAAPDDSSAAFAAGSVHVVPLRFGSGVRMKVLEAWARGVPVVTTPQGAAGLDARDGVELLVARDAASFAAALKRLRDEPLLASCLVRGGHAALRQRHDPATLAQRLLDIYRGAQGAAG